MAQHKTQQPSTIYQGFHEYPAMVGGGQQPKPAAVGYALPYQVYTSKATIIRKYGNILLINGLVTMMIGIAMASAAPEYWTSITGGGIWSGFFVIVAGTLCMRFGADDNSRGLRVGALVMCIFAIIFTLSCCIMFFIGFATGISCNNNCYWDYYNNFVCYDDCSYLDRRLGSILSLAVSVLNIKAFILSLMAAINLGRGGCCNPQESQGILVNTPVQPGYGGVVIANTNYQQQSPPYQPPTSATHPQASAPYSQQQAYNPNQPQYYPQQQYSQAQMPTTGGDQVTFGSDYQQQQRQEERKVMSK